MNYRALAGVEDLLRRLLQAARTRSKVGGVPPNEIAAALETVQELRAADVHSNPEIDVWGEDGEFPRTDWETEVCNRYTNLGYWEWVENSRDMAGEAADKTDTEDDAAKVRTGEGQHRRQPGPQERRSALGCQHRRSTRSRRVSADWLTDQGPSRSVLAGSPGRLPVRPGSALEAESCCRFSRLRLGGRWYREQSLRTVRIPDTQHLADLDGKSPQASLADCEFASHSISQIPGPDRTTHASHGGRHSGWGAL